eukprot:scaffold17750_cov132-Cylindrotheca_fusiformis.AAC.1
MGTRRSTSKSTRRPVTRVRGLKSWEMPSGCGSRFMEIAACFTISRFSRRGYLLYGRPATVVRFLSLIVWMARSTSGTCSSGAQ